jgi:hypothetical protein
MTERSLPALPCSTRLNHAAAKRADLSHWKYSCLKGSASKTHDPQTGGLVRSLLICRASGFVQSTNENCKVWGSQAPNPCNLNPSASAKQTPHQSRKGLFTDDEVARTRNNCLNSRRMIANRDRNSPSFFCFRPQYQRFDPRIINRRSRKSKRRGSLRSISSRQETSTNCVHKTYHTRSACRMSLYCGR